VRNYQTLTVIGGIITILIVLAVALLFSVGNIVHESFGNFTKQYGSQSSVNQYQQGRQMFSSGLNYMSVAIPVGVFGSVAAMVLVFVIKDKFKPLGIILIVLGVIVLIATGGFGIVGFAMFVVAGIVTLRYKPNPSMELTK
jgi:hypothetical protein